MKSSGSAEELTIGALADVFGLATHVLRHWESVGLISPDRVTGGHRRYGAADVRRVAMILMGKEAGLSLRAMKAVMSTADPMDHADLLRRHVTDLEQRIAHAVAAKALIEHALDCPIPFDECPHAKEQIAARIPARSS